MPINFRKVKNFADWFQLQINLQFGSVKSYEMKEIIDVRNCCSELLFVTPRFLAGPMSYRNKSHPFTCFTINLFLISNTKIFDSQATLSFSICSRQPDCTLMWQEKCTLTFTQMQSYIWAVSHKNRSLGLCRCHTKRRLGYVDYRVIPYHLNQFIESPCMERPRFA